MRDIPYKSLSLILKAQHYNQLFDHTQHIVVTPNARLVCLLGSLIEITPPLRSIIVVQLWPLPDERETYNPDLLWVKPSEN